MFKVIIAILIYILTPLEAHATKQLILTLRDVIFLAVRENPNVEQAQLNHLIQKLNLHEEQWQFKPHFGLQATTTSLRNYSVTTGGYVSQNRTGMTSSIAWQNSLGTRATLAAANTYVHNYNPGLSLQIIQPLIRGFGKPIVESALKDAKDNEIISRLKVEGVLRDTITLVINTYLDVISAENTLAIDQQSMQRLKESLIQTKLFIHAGEKAPNELVMAEAEVANAETKIENDKNNLDKMRYTLLVAIGIDPNTNINLITENLANLIKKYHMPSLYDAKKLMLDNDIQYAIDNITLNGATKRNLAKAVDNARWQLDLTLNTSTGNGTGGGRNAGLNSIVNGVNQSNSVMLNLNIPVDDQSAKVALAMAKIALHEARVALQQEKWNKETDIISEWKTIQSGKRSLHYAQKSESLQFKSYHISMQKYYHGLIDRLELQSAQQQLNSVQQSLSLERINYLKSLSNFDDLVGGTLKTWNVRVRYT